MSNDFEKQAYQEVLENAASDATIKAVELDVLAKEKGFKEFTDENNPSNGSTFFAWGTELADSGKALFKSTNKLHHEMDFAGDCASKFDAEIGKENRQNLIVNLNQVRSNFSTSQVYLINSDAKDYYNHTRWSLGQMLNRSRAPSGALSVLAPTDPKQQSLPVYLKNDVFNSYMENATTKRGIIKANLRIRDFKGKKEVFAAVSPSYQTYDANQACKDFAQYCHETGKGQIKYDGRRWKFIVTVMSDIEPTVGEIFQARTFITGTDDGSAPVTVGSEVVRVRCLNLTVLTSEITDSVKHSCKTMSERIHELMKQANDRISSFADMWKQANTENLADPVVVEQVGIDKLFQLLVDRKYVVAPGIEPATMVSRLMSAWATEPGYTKAAVLNAVTRAAHTNTWSSPWVAEDISEQAGQMLYNYVYFSNTDLGV